MTLEVSEPVKITIVFERGNQRTVHEMTALTVDIEAKEEDQIFFTDATCYRVPFARDIHVLMETGHLIAIDESGTKIRTTQSLIDKDL